MSGKGGEFVKDFSEFAKTLTEEKICEIAERVNVSGISVTLPITESNVADFMTNVTATNLKFTVELLRLYHEWLQQ